MPLFQFCRWVYLQKAIVFILGKTEFQGKCVLKPGACPSFLAYSYEKQKMPL